MLSQTAAHGIRALLYLAGEAVERSASVDEIAIAIGAPRNYLAKTLNNLARRGIVSGSRGPGGGFRLEIDPIDLPVARLIDAFEPPVHHRMCLLGGRRCDAERPCAAHGRWTQMWQESANPLHRTSLADLLGTAGKVPAGPPKISSSPTHQPLRTA